MKGPNMAEALQATGSGSKGERRMEEQMADARVLYRFLSDIGVPPEKAELVLAMGGSDLGVADTAVRAFFERQAEWLICTGGFGKDTTGVLAEPESVLYAKRCIKLGVPESRILIEDQSTNSGENFRFAKALMEKRGIRPRGGIIASKPYMAKRAWATGTRQWPEVTWGVVYQKAELEEYLQQRGEAAEVLELMVGDLQRLRVYGGSFQEPVEVPEAVWAAYERLAADGYNRFVTAVG